MQIAEALSLLRAKLGLTQTAATRRAGVPDYRTLSHWEKDRKHPRLELLYGYLKGLGLDFCDLQDALNEVEAPSPTGCRAGLERLERRGVVLERRLGVEAGPEETDDASRVE